MTIKYLKYIILCLLTIGLSACSEDESSNPNNNGKQVTITLSVPSIERSASPKPKAMPADEEKINTIDVLVFKTDPQFPDDPNKGTYYYRATVVYAESSSTFTTELIVSSEKQTIVVLANCRTEVNTLMGTISKGDSKADVIQALSLTQKSAFDSNAMTGIPMWGEITNQHIVASYTPAIFRVALTRMLAKINIVNNATSNFTLEEAYLYNPRQKGSVIPNNWDNTNSVVTAPTFVDDSKMEQGSKFSFLTTSGANKIENLIYTFEANNKSEATADKLDATCLVVGGIYQGGSKKAYYRIDLKNQTTDVYYDILRNHSYNITITSVTYEGEEKPDHAYKGVSRIKANVEVWNEVTGKTQYPGSGTLYVEKQYAWIMLDGTTVATTDPNVFRLKASHPDGWRVISKPEWVTLNPMSGDKSIDDLQTITFTATNATNSNPNGRQGEIVIQTGQLEYTLYAMQGSCGRDGIPFTQKLSNYTYKTHQYPANAIDNGTMQCWMVENSREGTGFGKGYGLDQAGAIVGSTTSPSSSLGQLNGTYYIRTQLGNACPTGWEVPTNPKWEGLTTYVKNNKTANEATWWVGSLGVKNNAFAGYTGITSAAGRAWHGWDGAGYWWSSTPTQYYTSLAATYSISVRTEVSSLYGIYAYSVRCIRK